MIYFLNMCQSNVFLIADLMSQTCLVDEMGFSNYNNLNNTNYSGHWIWGPIFETLSLFFELLHWLISMCSITEQKFLIVTN